MLLPLLPLSQRCLGTCSHLLSFQGASTLILLVRLANREETPSQPHHTCFLLGAHLPAQQYPGDIDICVLPT